MNIENISKHVATVIPEARKDMAAGQWDDVMTDALYAACGAETTDDMTEARLAAEKTASRVKATVTEHGNGLPGIGSICYDQSTDTVYTVVGWDGSDRISTNGPGCGNSVNVLLEPRGSASDTTDDEWDEIESSNYGVSVETDEEVE